MAKSKFTGPRVACPVQLADGSTCGQEVAPKGLRFHIQLKHGLSRDQALERYGAQLAELPGAGFQPRANRVGDVKPPELSPPEQFVQSVLSRDGTPSDAPGGSAKTGSAPHPPELEPELRGPAIDAAGLDALKEPAGESKAPPPPAAELHVKPSLVDMGRVTEAAVKRLDRLASRALDVDADTQRDIDETAELMKPAAEMMGPKLGAWFWVLVFFFSLGAWWAGKVVQRAERRRQLGPATDTPRAQPAAAPVEEVTDRQNEYAA